MRVTISSALFDRLIAMATADPKNEICGLLLGEGRSVEALIPAPNVAADLTRRFEIDPATHFAAIRAARAGGAAVIGHYHSHPNGSAAPSAYDAAMIAADGEVWLIIAGTQVRAWRTHDGRFVETALSITPDAVPNACVAS